MPSGERCKGKMYEKVSPLLVARLQNITTLAYVQQADLSSITWRAYEYRTPTVPIVAGTLVIANCIFNTLQQNAIAWPVDSIGFNFKQIFPKDALPDKGIYIIDVKFTPISGDPFYEAWEIDTQRIKI